MNAIWRNPRTSEAPVSAELDRCITGGAYPIARYRVGQGQRSILYVLKPGSRVNDTRVNDDRETYHSALATLILLHGGRFPNLVVIFGHIEISTRVQRVLD